jgi:hypothetical protein
LELSQFLHTRVRHRRAVQVECGELLEWGQLLQSRVRHLREGQVECGEVLERSQRTHSLFRDLAIIETHFNDGFAGLFVVANNSTAEFLDQRRGLVLRVVGAHG